MMLKQYVFFSNGSSAGEAVIFSESKQVDTFTISLAGKTIFLSKKDAEDIRDILNPGYSICGVRIEFVAEENESSS